MAPPPHHHHHPPPPPPYYSNGNGNGNGNGNQGLYHYSNPLRHEESSVVDECLSVAREIARSAWRFWRGRGRHAVHALLLRSARQLRRNMAMRRLLSFPHLLVVAWVLVLLWGERWVFRSRVDDCRWSNWEKWPSGANPHHLIFVADPQIIDPHSYPGRPWPLSSLTVLITDNYLRRSYNQLQLQLHPDTVFFLGDLFDGGREWKTIHGEFVDPEWNHRPEGEKSHARKWKKKYGEDYWLKEYARFGDIFFGPWNDGGTEPGEGQRGRKLIASLPGNHDLGFGSEVKMAVRNRFEAYFGDANRVDVIGNHSFVSVDTVSLSARSAEEAARADLRNIYKPAEIFLDEVKGTKRRAVERELRFWQGDVEELQHKHGIEDLETADFTKSLTLDPAEAKAELPTILLTHVPLYRPPGTPCGPMREHWPPTKPPKGQAGPVVPDHRNAITVAKGYQYQNVLSEADSAQIVDKVGGVVHAFSGDDHDYCELAHDERQGNVREITVKSMSMAMGVPTPGFLMVSLHNPVDPATGAPLSSGGGDGSATLQTHLCLLPNQISTFARYGGFALVCAALLVVRALLVPVLGLTPFALDSAFAAGEGGSSGEASSILPVFNSKAKLDDYDAHGGTSGAGYSASHFLASSAASRTRDRSSSLGVRPGGLAAQARNASPKDAQHHHHQPGTSPRRGGRWGWGEARSPKIEISGDDDDYDDYTGRGSRGLTGGGGRWRAAARPRRGRMGVVVREVWTTAWRVAWMVVVVWGYIAYKG
ncbi:Manganese ion homeostasis [Pleurostoma richardsiae]|uniref:Manganese ion homeostasis n=1 Tax=Pleurostoma richardsiae TaxID=41990 RepID=A0AA38VGU0_9PEZI|nr:Manganese ion homeostasis [Pleurostoma richardsiae]